jgi:hypothetical protein
VVLQLKDQWNMMKQEERDEWIAEATAYLAADSTSG